MANETVKTKIGKIWLKIVQALGGKTTDDGDSGSGGGVRG